MIASNRGRMTALSLVALATFPTVWTSLAPAQTPAKPGRAATAPPPPQAAAKPGEVPRFQEVRVPTNTTDPIATVNGEIITRQQLADECVARKGQEILETLIARRLIEQAMRGSKLEITAAEIDKEIDAVAWSTAQATREVWLRTLDKERGISPAQYARDIIYPALALKKLAAKRIQVTEQDIQKAYEANFGEKMRCRLIMVENIRAANEIWTELQRNPAGFERIARERSRDNSTKASGGMLPEPIARHAYPETVSDAAYKQLVDGNPDDKDSKGDPIKPKDGAITGPIQVHETGWVIIKREELLPPTRTGSINDPNVRNMLKEQMLEVKQNEAVSSLYNDLLKASTIDNKLTGQVKMANEEQEAEYKKGLDQKVERMSIPKETQPVTPTGRRSPSNANVSPAGAPITPVGVPTDAASAAGRMQAPLKSPTPPGN